MEDHPRPPKPVYRGAAPRRVSSPPVASPESISPESPTTEPASTESAPTEPSPSVPTATPPPASTSTSPPPRSPRPKRESRPQPNAKTLDEIKRKFRIQRKRLGKIIALKPDSTFGFIDAEDFRDDVFFHLDVFDGMTKKGDWNVRLAPEEGMWVEFEIDDVRFEIEGKLRATTVRPTQRPIGRKLSGRDATFKIVTHHPRARRKRPTWRE